VISGTLGLWWVHALLLVVIAFLMARQAGIRWVMLRFSGKAPSL
jgi:hypothetical protein